MITVANFCLIKNAIGNFIDSILGDLLETGQFETVPKGRRVVEELMAPFADLAVKNVSARCRGSGNTPDAKFCLDKPLCIDIRFTI